jgi:hypothetical protein
MPFQMLDIVRRREEKALLKKIQSQQTQQPPNETQQQPKRKKKNFEPTRKVEGAVRVELFSQWIDRQVKEIEQAHEFLGEERMRRIVKNLSDAKNKISSTDNDDKLEGFKTAAGAKKNRKVQSKHFADLTPWMDGSIILSYLTKKDGARPFLMAEIRQRNVKLPKPAKKVSEMTDKEKKKHQQKWDGQTEQDLKVMLRDHERAVDKGGREGLCKGDGRKTIKPLSQKMKEWLPKQWEIYKRRKGLIEETPNA